MNKIEVGDIVRLSSGLADIQVTRVASDWVIGRYINSGIPWDGPVGPLTV